MLTAIASYLLVTCLVLLAILGGLVLFANRGSSKLPFELREYTLRKFAYATLMVMGALVMTMLMQTF